MTDYRICMNLPERLVMASTATGSARKALNTLTYLHMRLYPFCNVYCEFREHRGINWGKISQEALEERAKL